MLVKTIRIMNLIRKNKFISIMSLDTFFSGSSNNTYVKEKKYACKMSRLINKEKNFLSNIFCISPKDLLVVDG